MQGKDFLWESSVFEPLAGPGLTFSGVLGSLDSVALYFLSSPNSAAELPFNLEHPCVHTPGARPLQRTVQTQLPREKEKTSASIGGKRDVAHWALFRLLTLLGLVTLRK